MWWIHLIPHHTNFILVECKHFVQKKDVFGGRDVVDSFDSTPHQFHFGGVQAFCSKERYIWWKRCGGLNLIPHHTNFILVECKHFVQKEKIHLVEDM